MWPFTKRGSDADKVVRRINRVLNRLGRGSATILDFSASRLAEGVKFDEVTERDFEEIRSSIEHESSKISKLQRIELLLFASILLVHLNVAQEISLLGFNLSASENLLAILIFIFSTIQVGVAIAINDLTVRKKLLKLILLSCGNLDPSGTRRLLYTEKIDASSPWVQVTKRGDYVPGWQYVAITLSMLPMSLHLMVVILAIPVAIIQASYTLAESNDWSWIHTAIFASAVLGLISRFLLFPLMHVLKVNYTEWKMRKKFYRDAEVYGVSGALSILDDHVQNMARDVDLINKTQKRHGDGE